MKAEKKKIDWERIDPHWRAGLLSVLQIAAEYEKATGQSVSHTAINKHFKELGVPRDLILRNHQQVSMTQPDALDSAGFLYVVGINAAGEFYYKIGISKNVSARIEQHQCASPFEIFVAACYMTGNMRTEEKQLHNMFSKQQVRGEWFRLSIEDLKQIAARSLLVNHG